MNHRYIGTGVDRGQGSTLVFPEGLNYPYSNSQLIYTITPTTQSASPWGVFSMGIVRIGILQQSSTTIYYGFGIGVESVNCIKTSTTDIRLSNGTVLNTNALNVKYSVRILATIY